MTVATIALAARPDRSTGSRSVAHRISGEAALDSTYANSPAPSAATARSAAFAPPNDPRPTVTASA